MVEYLPSNPKALSSNPSNRKRTGWGEGGRKGGKKRKEKKQFLLYVP
jgi:hypothetical protein